MKTDSEFEKMYPYSDCVTIFKDFRMPQTKIRIKLGNYDRMMASVIQRYHIHERNKLKERDPKRIRSHILIRPVKGMKNLKAVFIIIDR